MSSAYCSSAVAVSTAATAATCNPLLSSHSNFQLFYRFTPKSFKLVANCPNPLILHSNIRRHRFFCAAETEASSADEEIQAALEEEEEEEEEEVEEEEDERDEEVEEEDADEKQTTQASGEEGRLYVGNLPYTITSSELSQLFGEAGNVVDVQIVYDKVTDRSRGFGFVTMGTIEEAKEAIQMFNSSQIGGRTVKVNYPEVPRGGEREVMRTKIRDTNQSYVDSPHKIYAGNLGWNLTSQGLKDAFADQPGVLGAKVIYERNTGRSRGFGFISFESAEDVQSALATMNGVEVEGRALRLNLASERERPTVSPPPSVEEGETEEASLESSEVLSNVST
ncbi:RNA recognition motif domain [Arabidopsis thaliana x Arabidopsis arenosa]|uniref:RNA recognition motif domain n=1 Tax=Arabidopsis thaliana x Arabidopsis arenosa TaxID=1240361 RepID=A0A8T1ZR16_9BRAS|nr:RNA recognition motif domain [Arabidopsis thaliana x Arabidopsis arenosa]